jgi:hypothetical protein
LFLILLVVSGLLPQILFFRQSVKIHFNVHVNVDVDVRDDQFHPAPVPIPQLNVDNEASFFQHYYELLDRTSLDCARQPSEHVFFTPSWDEAVRKCLSAAQCLAVSRNALTGWTVVCDGGSWKHLPVRSLFGWIVASV